MKRLGIGLLIVLFVGMLGMAKTDIFDSITVTGTGSFTGTLAFTGTTITFSPTTSFLIYTPTFTVGYDAGAAWTWAVSDTTGNLAITAAGSTKNFALTTAGAATFTFGSFLIDGSTVVLDNGATLDNTGSATELLIQETNVKLSGAVQMEAGAVTVGTSGVSFDTTFYSDTAGKTLVWGDTEFLDLTVAAGDTGFQINNGNFVLSQVTAAADRNSPWLDLVGYDHDTTAEIDMGWRVEVTAAADYKMSLYEDDLNTEVFSIDESGNVQLDGSLTIIEGAIADSMIVTGDIKDGTITAVDIGDTELAALGALTFADDQIILGTGAGTIAMASCTTFAQGLLDDTDEATFKATVNLEIGTDVQAYDAELAALAGLTFADDKIILGTGAGTIGTADCTVFAQSILDDTDEATFKATVNLEPGTDVQAYDAELAAVAGLTFADDKIILGTGAGTIGTADCTVFAQSILDDTDEATFKATVNLEPGTDVQAYDAELAALAGLTFADDKIILGTGAGTVGVADCTVFAQSILDDTDEATFKATTNLEIGTDVQAYHANLAAYSIADNQMLTEYIAFDIEEATMDADGGTGIKVASVDVNATGLIMFAYVNVTQGYNEASDTIELVINDTDDIATPVTTLVGATDQSAAGLLAYQPATGATVLGATTTTNRYVVVGYKDVGNDGGTGANLQGTLVVVYLKQ